MNTISDCNVVHTTPDFETVKILNQFAVNIAGFDSSSAGINSHLYIYNLILAYF